MRKKEQSAGKKKKEKKKKHKPGGKGATCADSRKKGTPSCLQLRGGPCAPVRMKGERSGGREGEKKKENQCAAAGGEKSRRSGRRGQTGSRQSQVSDVALFGEVPMVDFVMHRKLSKLSKSYSLASPSHFFCDTPLPPPFRTALWGMHSSPNCSGDVPSPLPRSGMCLRSGTHPPPFFLFLSPLTVFSYRCIL